MRKPKEKNEGEKKSFCSLLPDDLLFLSLSILQGARRVSLPSFFTSLFFHLPFFLLRCLFPLVLLLSLYHFMYLSASRIFFFLLVCDSSAHNRERLQRTQKRKATSLLPLSSNHQSLSVAAMIADGIIPYWYYPYAISTGTSIADGTCFTTTNSVVDPLDYIIGPAGTSGAVTILLPSTSVSSFR